MRPPTRRPRIPHPASRIPSLRLMTEPLRFTRDRLATLLGEMARRRIVVVGDAMLDIYLAGDAERISPEAPVPVVTVRGRRYALGGAANVAANVAAIGAECRLVAVIGDDARGDSVRGELMLHRLTDKHLVVAAARPTTSKTRVVARGQQVVRIDEEVEDAIPDRALDQVLVALDAAMADADALVIEDYNKGLLTPAVIERAMALGKKRGVPIVVDPKFKNFFAYRGAAVFKPNRRELEQAMGAALDLAHPDALPTSLEKLGVHNLLLTLGAEGMVLVTQDGRSPASPRWRARCSTSRARATRLRPGWARPWRRAPRCARGRCWPTTPPASRSPRRASRRSHRPRCWRCTRRSMISWGDSGEGGCYERGTRKLERGTVGPSFSRMFRVPSSALFCLPRALSSAVRASDS